MNDDIILPDEKTMEKMAESYKNIKVKQFEQKVNIMTQSGKKVFLLKVPPVDYTALKTNLSFIYSKNAQIKSAIENALNRRPHSPDCDVVRSLIAQKNSSQQLIQAMDTHGQITAFTASKKQNKFNAFSNKTLLLNQAELIDCCTRAIELLPRGKERSVLRKVRDDELAAAVIMLLLFHG